MFSLSNESATDPIKEKLLFDYISKHQGIHKSNLFKWFGSANKGLQLRKVFWRSVELKKQIFFHNKTKKIYFYDRSNFIIGKYFNKYKSKQGFVIEANKKLANKTFCIKPKNLTVHSFDQVLVKKQFKNRYIVCKIIEKNTQWISGKLKQLDSGIWIVVVHSFIMNEQVFIENDKNLSLVDGAIVQISYPSRNNENKITAKIHSIISANQSSQAEVIEICKKHEIRYEFDESIRKTSLLLIKNKERYKNFKQRRNLINDFFVTIDSSQSKDLDDAFCVTKKNEGVYNIKIAIADVSNYISYGDLIDQEAKLHACSNYFSNIVYPMLPKNLSNDICSLNCESEKFVIVCDVDYDVVKNSVIDYSLYHAKIKSKYQLCYSFVNKILEENRNENKELFSFIIDSYYLSKKINLKFLNRRHFTINRDELKISTDKDNNVTNIELKQGGKAENIIENFMMITNYCVADFMKKHNISGIYRKHEIIKKDNLIQAWNIISNIYPKTFTEHFTISNSSSQIYKSLHKHDEFLQTNYIPILVLLSFYETAYYSASSGSHFGLGIEIYCHFSSPIRRYSDLYVHYVISNFLYKKAGICIDESNLLNVNNDLSELCFNLNWAIRSSKQGERDFRKLQQAKYLQAQPSNKIYEGYISNIFRGRLYLSMNIYQGVVQPTDLGDELFIENQELKTLRGRNTNKQFTIGDKVKAVPKFININTGTVSWKLI